MASLEDRRTGSLISISPTERGGSPSLEYGLKEQHHHWTMERDLECSIIPKSKNFVWRLATSALAVKTNLIKQGMVIDPGCSVCGETESTEHMAVGCKWTESIWATVLGCRVDGTAMHNINDWLEGMGRQRGAHQPGQVSS